MARVGLARSDRSYEAVRMALEYIREDVCVPRDLPVLIKPNLVWPSFELTGTPVDAVQATLDFLVEFGVEKFIIGEATAGGNGDTLGAFERYGYRSLEESYDVELRDLNHDEVVTFEILDESLEPVTVHLAKTYFTSYIVSVARMKSHDSVVVTLSIKNTAIGSILNPDRQVLRHEPQPINLSIARLYQAAPSSLVVIDGVVGMEGNGPVSGTPISSGIALAGTDALAVDVVGAELMGFDPRTVGYLWYLGELRRLHREDIAVLGEDPAACITRYKGHDKLAQQLAWWVEGWESYLGGNYLRPESDAGEGIEWMVQR